MFTLPYRDCTFRFCYINDFVEYLYHQLYWKHWFHDVMCDIKDIIRVDDDYTSYFIRTGISTSLLYNEIDNNPLFKGTTAKEDRSKMNVTFVMNKPEMEEEFMNVAKAAGIVGIKGHRSVGGFRASLYNALPIESVQVLVDVMKEFAKKNMPTRIYQELYW